MDRLTRQDNISLLVNLVAREAQCQPRMAEAAVREAAANLAPGMERDPVEANKAILRVAIARASVVTDHPAGAPLHAAVQEELDQRRKRGADVPEPGPPGDAPAIQATPLHRTEWQVSLCRDVERIADALEALVAHANERGAFGVEDEVTL